MSGVTPPEIGPALSGAENSFHWTPAKVILSLFLFVVAGLAEIGGGWLVWQAIRMGKPLYWAIFGSLVLISYGFIPTAQPTADFGRIYAVYGGFFIVLSYLWGWVADGDRPDLGRAISSTVVGMALGFTGLYSWFRWQHINLFATSASFCLCLARRLHWSWHSTCGCGYSLVLAST